MPQLSSTFLVEFTGESLTHLNKKENNYKVKNEAAMLCKAAISS